jgi:hypothetical protein
MNNINFGVEIECIINKDIIKNLEKWSYHSGAEFIVKSNLGVLKNWKAEEDGSLEGGFNSNSENNFCSCECYCSELDCVCDTDDCSGDCRDGDCDVCLNGHDYDNEFCIRNENSNCGVEFISNKATSIKEFKQFLKDFQKYFSVNGKYELNKVMKFNDSCGSHLHFSYDLNNFKFNDKVRWNKLIPARERFKDLINKSKIKSKRDILSYYNRSYSQELSEDNIKYWSNKKYSEFNISSEIQGYGLEWRSLNMLNITTWKEFNEFWDIVLSCVKELIIKNQRFTEKYNEKIEIKKMNKKVYYNIKLIKNENEEIPINIRMGENYV